MGQLADLERNWNLYGQADPMWAVRMAPDKQGGRWTPEEFFAAGEAEIATVLGHVNRLGRAPDFSGAALDFGCGVGRLTQALAGRFSVTYGVDISSAMVKRASDL